MIVKSAKDEIQQYLHDQANLAGDCEQVFIVEAQHEVAEILMEADRLKVPVTICGNHTSVTGSSLPSSGWVISTERLNRIIEINAEQLYVDIEPGVTLKALQEALKPHGLFFAPDPTEDSCFIGGMIGTNASGARSFKYGAVREFVEQLTLILAQGEQILLSRDTTIDGKKFQLPVHPDKVISFDIPETYVLPRVKNTVGYFLHPDMSPIDLFIGAEGTLGVITKARLKLTPLPENYISFVIFFDGLDEAFTFLDQIRDLSRKVNAHDDSPRIRARAIEFFDGRSLNLLRDIFKDIPTDAVAAFWIEQECVDAAEYDILLSLWFDTLESLSMNMEDIWFGVDERDRGKIVSMRHALPILVNDLVRSRGMKKLGTDIAVPDAKFKDFYQMAIAEVEKRKIGYVAFGHFGNSHLHLNMIPADSRQMTEGVELYGYLCLEAIKIGGTFSAEHGVGKLKRHYMHSMFGDLNIAFMKSVKTCFDPNQILGKDNLFINI